MAKDFNEQWNELIELRNRFIKGVAELPARDEHWSTPYSRLAIGEQELRDYSQKTYHAEQRGYNEQKQRWQRLARLSLEDGLSGERVLQELIAEGCPEDIAAGILGMREVELQRTKAAPKVA